MIMDTTGELFPEGKYTFRVAEIPSEDEVKGYQAWQWTFETDTDEGPRTYNERFMVWNLAPLMRALDFPEPKPGKFDWEPTEALGRSVEASIQHVTLDKGSSKGKVVARMTDIRIKSAKAALNKAAMQAQAPVASGDDIPF